ncbi:E3 ubiquitin-protein ligase UPL5 [Striga hermonthica]|uniref:HECT-type E3 ubiquitin transferase n=1 Tax=Striga hermonthica TaxID=68872 RepID=A0A9N7N197_STRHE|nr:E3 ubiquitin-protein ligase UPL5 [Striga hermonthica]
MSSKRRADDCADDALPLPINPSGNMRKDQNALPSSSSFLSSPLSPRPASPLLRSGAAGASPSAARIQFFVRILSDHTLVLHADPRDTIRSIHEKIQSITGISVIEQRLIYRGKQLQWEQTLSECGVQNDAGLHMVGRMRSTGHPQAWQLINDVVSQVFYQYKNNPSSQTFFPPTPRKTVKSMLLEFLSMTPRTDTDQASGHLQIFSASSAPAALVMLYMSSYKPNRDVAGDAITHFITSCKTILPKQHYHLCVPIVMEFCKLLSRAVGIDDSLYALCRSSLGTMVEFIDIGEKKDSVGLRDVFLFVCELATKLSSDLVTSTQSGSFSAPSISDVQDFAAFVAPVRNGIKADIGFCGPIRVPLSEELCRLPLCYANEIVVLHGIFFDLLSKLEKCMVKIEERLDRAKKCEGETFHVGCQYLDLLKELNSTSKLYQGCEEVFWETMKQRKSAVCYLILRCSRRSDDHIWISDCKEVTTFEARRHLAMMLLPEVKDDFDDLHEMLIDRSNLLAESFEYIINADLESLRAGLFMEFKNEEATGPGVLREWFFCVCQAIFNPQNPLFVACPNDRRRFFPNPASTVDPLDREYFNFVGKVIALALMHKVQVGIVFDRVFFLQLAGQPITLEDIRDADPTLYSSCKKILEMDPSAVDQDTLGLTFVDEIEELGMRRVTAEQVDHFAKGFADILSCRRLQRAFFRCLEAGDLDRMLYGSEDDISVDDWRSHTDYHGFKGTDNQISWFWKIVGSMTKEQKKVLLFFWTSIKHLPCEGFSGLASRLYIYKNSESSDRLPSSHTCFYRLCFPAYPTMSLMRDRLRIITQEHVGCSFGTW